MLRMQTTSLLTLIPEASCRAKGSSLDGPRDSQKIFVLFRKVESVQGSRTIVSRLERLKICNVVRGLGDIYPKKPNLPVCRCAGDLR